MLYIKIGENKYPIDGFQTFTTQIGNAGVRVIGDTPLADGFLIVDENDHTIADASEYRSLYREDAKCKEYTKVSEQILPSESYAIGDVPANPIQKQISALNRRITEITPYTATKEAYYGETEKVFYDVPNGNVTIFCDADNTFERIDNRLIVKFAEALSNTVEVTVMVQ